MEFLIPIQKVYYSFICRQSYSNIHQVVGNKSANSRHLSDESYDLPDALTIKIHIFLLSAFSKKIFIDLWSQPNYNRGNILY